MALWPVVILAKRHGLEGGRGSSSGAPTCRAGGTFWRRNGQRYVLREALPPICRFTKKPRHTTHKTADAPYERLYAKAR